MYFWSISEDSCESLSMESVINSVMIRSVMVFNTFYRPWLSQQKRETEYWKQNIVHKSKCTTRYAFCVIRQPFPNCEHVTFMGAWKVCLFFYLFSFVHVCLGSTYMCIFVCAWIQSLEVDVGCCSWWISILYWGRVSYFNSGGTMGITCLSFQWTVITGMLSCQPGIWIGTKGVNSGPQFCFGKHITLPCTKFAFLSRNQRLVCCTQFRDCTFGFIALES